MNDNQREFLQRLFAAAEMIETTYEAAIAGQSGKSAADSYTGVEKCSGCTLKCLP